MWLFTGMQLRSKEVNGEALSQGWFLSKDIEQCLETVFIAMILLGKGGKYS